jgi:hypothetical protein
MKQKLKIAAAVLLSALLATPPVYAQRETEVMVVEFVLDQVSVTGASAEIRNAGQTQHSIFVRLEHAPTLTCTDAGLSVQIEQGVSFQDDPDTVSWQLFGLPVTDTDYGAVGSVFRQNTSGATRNLRVNATGFDTVNCLLSVTYVGSTRPVPLFDIGGDSLEVIAEIYNFITVNNNPTCSLVDTFLFFNGPAGQLRICHNAVITDVGGGGGGVNQIVLNMTDAIVLDQTTDNSTAELVRLKSTSVGTDAFWLSGDYANGAQLMWTFRVPANYASAPVLEMSGLGSTAIGTYNFGATLRCLTPNNSEAWDIKVFDTINSLVGFSFSGNAHLAELTIPLTNDDGMAAGDICTMIFSQNSSGVQFLAISGVITYTGT